jgi:hypothetical protein
MSHNRMGLHGLLQGYTICKNSYQTNRHFALIVVSAPYTFERPSRSQIPPPYSSWVTWNEKNYLTRHLDISLGM